MVACGSNSWESSNRRQEASAVLLALLLPLCAEILKGSLQGSLHLKTLRLQKEVFQWFWGCVTTSASCKHDLFFCPPPLYHLFSLSFGNEASDYAAQPHFRCLLGRSTWAAI